MSKRSLMDYDSVPHGCGYDEIEEFDDDEVVVVKHTKSPPRNNDAVVTVKEEDDDDLHLTLSPPPSPPLDMPPPPPLPLPSTVPFTPETQAPPPPPPQEALAATGGVVRKRKSSSQPQTADAAKRLFHELSRDIIFKWVCTQNHMMRSLALHCTGHPPHHRALQALPNLRVDEQRAILKAERKGVVALNCVEFRKIHRVCVKQDAYNHLLQQIRKQLQWIETNKHTLITTDALNACIESCKECVERKYPLIDRSELVRLLDLLQDRLAECRRVNDDNGSAASAVVDEKRRRLNETCDDASSSSSSSDVDSEDDRAGGEGEQTEDEDDDDDEEKKKKQ